MKITVNYPEGHNPDFPCLMKYKYDEFIVFMTNINGENGTGVVIFDPTQNHGLGYVSANWYVDDFVKFKGTLTLSN